MADAEVSKKSVNFPPTRIVLLGTAVLLLSSLAQAEAPMAVDDASTLDKGGLKFEGALRKDHKQRGPELVFGYSPVKNLELEVSLADDRDRSVSPATRLRAVGVGAKWVPIQREQGWSLGLKFDWGQTRVDEPSTPLKFTAHETALSGLATYRTQGDHALHLNLGTKRIKALGFSETVGTWGLGYELPLIKKLTLGVEIFGERHSGPDKAVGLRYEIFEGFKLSGSLGRGNDRTFGQLGFAWEF